MATNFLSESINDSAIAVYMILPILIAICAVLFLSIIANAIKVSLLGNRVSSEYTYNPSCSIDENLGEDSSEEEDMQRMTDIYENL